MKNYLQSIKIIILALILTVGINYVFAWTGPSQTPPNGNVDAPINTGNDGQAKSGKLSIAKTSLPTNALEVNGTAAAADLVLTGNANVGSGLYVIGSATIGDNATIGNSLFFNNALGARMTLYSGYTLGIQPSTLYLRSADEFKFYRGGVHNDTQGNAGVGGLTAMTIGSTGTTIANGLTVNGTTVTTGLRVTGGSPANNKVLTSDSSGNATWQTPASSVPAGTLCGMYKEDNDNGNTLIVSCNGFNPSVSCPTGYTKRLFDIGIQGSQRNMLTCSKD